MAQKRPTGPLGSRDGFGSHVNRSTHRINMVMDAKGRSVERIDLLCNYGNHARIYQHMRWLRDHGFAFEPTPGIWALTRLGVSAKQKSSGSHLAQSSLIDDAAADDSSTDGYDPDGTDRRSLVIRQIRERRGQSRFREALRRRYGDRCLVTGCEVLAVLEAAHISPYLGTKENHAANGLLLRADIHTLFDLDLLGIEPSSLRVQLHPKIATEYAEFEGISLQCRSKRPSESALSGRYATFKQRLKSYD